MTTDRLKHSSLLAKTSRMVTYGQHFMRMHETLYNMSRALDSVQKPRREMYVIVLGLSVVKKRKRVEGGERCFEVDGVCFF